MYMRQPQPKHRQPSMIVPAIREPTVRSAQMCRKKLGNMKPTGSAPKAHAAPIEIGPSSLLPLRRLRPEKGQGPSRNPALWQLH